LACCHGVVNYVCCHHARQKGRVHIGCHLDSVLFAVKVSELVLMVLPMLWVCRSCRLQIQYYPIVQRKRVQKASVVNNYEDNSWAFVVITCLFA
jgi:hypothetical protein